MLYIGSLQQFICFVLLICYLQSRSKHINNIHLHSKKSKKPKQSLIKLIKKSTFLSQQNNQIEDKYTYFYTVINNLKVNQFFQLIFILKSPKQKNKSIQDSPYNFITRTYLNYIDCLQSSFMGNQESQSLFEQDWSIKKKAKSDIPGEPQTVINQNGMMAQLYEMELQRGHDISKQFQIYSHRNQSKSGHLVNVLAVFKQSDKFLQCAGGRAYIRVLTQNIPVRLHKTQNLTRKEGLILLEGVLKGFQEITSIRKIYFQPNQMMIGWSDKSVPKVWLNPNFAVNHLPLRCKAITCEQMIWELVYLISSKTVGKKLVPINSHLTNFNQAINITKREISLIDCLSFMERKTNIFDPRDRNKQSASKRVSHPSLAKSEPRVSYPNASSEEKPVRSTTSYSGCSLNRSHIGNFKNLTPPKSIPIPQEKPVPEFLRTRQQHIIKNSKNLTPIVPYYPLRHRLYTQNCHPSSHPMNNQNKIHRQKKKVNQKQKFLDKSTKLLPYPGNIKVINQPNFLKGSHSGLIRFSHAINPQNPRQRSISINKSRSKSPVFFTYTNKPLLLSNQSKINNTINLTNGPRLRTNTQTSNMTQMNHIARPLHRNLTQNGFPSVNAHSQSSFYAVPSNRFETFQTQNSWDNLQKSTSILEEKIGTQKTIEKNKAEANLQNIKSEQNPKTKLQITNKKQKSQGLIKPRKQLNKSQKILADRKQKQAKPRQSKNEDPRKYNPIESECTIKNSSNLQFKSQDSFTQYQLVENNAGIKKQKIPQQTMISKILEVNIDPKQFMKENVLNQSKTKTNIPRRSVADSENSIPSFLKKKSSLKQIQNEDIANQYHNRPLTKVQEEYQKMFIDNDQKQKITRKQEQSSSENEFDTQELKKEQMEAYSDVLNEKPQQKNNETKNFKKNGSFQIPETPFFYFDSKKKQKKESKVEELDQLNLDNSYDEYLEEEKFENEGEGNKQSKEYKMANFGNILDSNNKFSSFSEAEKFMGKKIGESSKEKMGPKFTSFGKRLSWDDDDGFSDLGRKLQEMSDKFNQKLDIYDSNIVTDRFTKEYQDDDELGYALENGL